MAAPLAGILIENNGLPWAFWTYATIMLIGLFVSQRFIFSHTAHQISFQHGLRILFTNRHLVLFLATSFVCGMAFTSVNVYLFAYMEQLGISKSLMGFALTIATISELPVLFFSDRLLLRFRPHGLLVVAIIATCVRLFLYAIFTAPLGILAFQIINGLTFPALWVAGVSYANENRDLAILANAIIHDFPDHYSWYSEHEYTYNKIKQPNRNLLLYRDPTVDGIKTGHTESAGYCLVSSSRRGEMRLISVVIGTSSEEARAKESQKLLGFGFGFYETHNLYAEAQPLKSLRIWKGESEQLALGLAHPLYVTLPRGAYSELNASLSVEKTIIAPAQKGQSYGKVVVRLGEETLASQPLVALQSIPEGGLITRLMDDVRLWLN